MPKTILITGGAGFIGSHLADALLQRGYRVRALDNLSPQVHGPDAQRPVYLHPDVQLVVADVRDAEAVRRAVQGVDAVFHLAAAVGVGQSMYEIAHYTAVNNVGTAVLLEALIAQKVERLVVASSMSLYGEGRYLDAQGRACDRLERTLQQLREGKWEPTTEDGAPLFPVATAEDKPPTLASVYALSKFDQERLCLMVGRAYDLPTVALRFFNVYGPRQALSNPYTGVLAIFASRLLNGKAPLIYEDGLQQRDFVSVHDVTRACLLALERPAAVGRALNIGRGRPVTIEQLAQHIARELGRPIEPHVTGQYRMGDVRHCFADITAARTALGYEPQISLAHGLRELADWLHGQAALDGAEGAHQELRRRGLTLTTEGKRP